MCSKLGQVPIWIIWRRPGPLGMDGGLCGVSWELPAAIAHQVVDDGLGMLEVIYSFLGAEFCSASFET